MESTLFAPAALSADDLKALRSFEQKTGHVVVALKPRAQKLAALSEEEAQQLRSLEQKLGVVMVAYDQAS